MINIKNTIYLMAFLMLGVLLSCNTEDLDPTLEQDKDVEGSITKVEDLEGILLGTYNRMTNVEYYGRDFIIHNEVRTDNVFPNGNSGRFQTPGGFNYLPSHNDGTWIEGYRVIATANIIIGTDISTLEGEASYATHIQGQAYAIRALAHFDILRNHGQQHTGGTLGIPYITEFLGENLTPARDNIKKNIGAIMADLQMAFDMMNDSYFDSSKEFMSKYTAKAIESKVATYFGMWDVAKSASEAVINSGLYSIIPADQYVASFAQDGSPNSIFELAFSDIDNLGSNSLGFIYKGDVYGDIQVLPNVESLYDTTDVRADILGYEGDKLRNLGKYPELNGYDNIPVIRYEEIILNYAEALFETGGDAAAQLNKLTAERGAAAYTSVTKDDIINERRKELIFEGFRYDDLLRTGKSIEKVEVEQAIIETIPYGDYRMAFPIPQDEIDANSNMVQNDGYE